MMKTDFVCFLRILCTCPKWGILWSSRSIERSNYALSSVYALCSVTLYWASGPDWISMEGHCSDVSWNDRDKSASSEKHEMLCYEWNGKLRRFGKSRVTYFRQSKMETESVKMEPFLRILTVQLRYTLMSKIQNSKQQQRIGTVLLYNYNEKKSHWKCMALQQSFFLHGAWPNDRWLVSVRKI